MKSIIQAKPVFLFLIIAAALSVAGTAIAGTQIIRDWQFNTVGDTEGWKSRSSWYLPEGIFVDLAVDGSATVLGAADLAGNGDVGILLDGEFTPVELPENCSNWETVTVRMRQLDANPPEGNPVAFAGGAGLWLDGVLADDLPLQSSDIWTVEYQADNWVVFSADLTGLSGRTEDITGLRFDPIQSTEGNFEIDYIQLAARSVLYASTYYLDAINGDDETGDGTEANPFKTVAAVWDLLEGGNTVIMADGNYGMIDIYNEGWVREPEDIFSDYVIFKAAEGASVVFDNITMGTHIAPDTDYTNGMNSKYSAFLRFENLEIADGIKLQSTADVQFENCLIKRVGPYVGSVENIEKIAVELVASRGITLESCEITDTGVGIFASGHDVNILNCDIHGGSHDGIRPWGLRDSLFEGNEIHGFTDGVTDDEGFDWNRHCDLIHFSIRGPGYEGWGNHNVTVRGNKFYDAQGQSLIINGYLSTPTRHGDITIENNIFLPVGGTMVNLVEKTDGVIFRNNTVIDPGYPIVFEDSTMSNTTVRFGGDLTGVEIYNNIFANVGIDSGCGMDFFNYNILRDTANLPNGLGDSRAPGRFNIMDQYPVFTNPTEFDGALNSSSIAINAGTKIMAPSDPPAEDIAGTVRDARPDIGAWEYPGLSPEAEEMPEVYNDTKTRFVDDFEDGHFNDIDPWLDGPATQGMSWYNVDGFSYKYYVDYRRDNLDRNSLFMPMGSEYGRAAWVFSEQGADWVDYTFDFDCSNAYVSYGGGVCVLVKDKDNCYYLDLSSSNGRLIRIMGGMETVLDTSSAIELSNTGDKSYSVEVDVEPDGITISVDAGRDGNVDFSYTDTDMIARTIFSSGGVGFHCDNDDKWHYMFFDNIEVNVLESNAAPEYLDGDADRNGTVDIFDFLLLKANFGTTGGAVWEQGDFNDDGNVDIFDFLLLKGNFGQSM